MPLTSSKLVPLIAEVTTYPAKTVGTHLRNLRVANLISTGGRGPNAPHMTAADATHLLLATWTSDFVMQSVATVQRAYQLKLEQPLHFLWDDPRLEADYASDCPSQIAMHAIRMEKSLGSSFGSALENLITAASNRLLFLKAQVGHFDEHELSPGIYIEAVAGREAGEYALKKAIVIVDYEGYFGVEAHYLSNSLDYSKANTGKNRQHIRRNRGYEEMDRVVVLREGSLLKIGSAL